MVCVAKLTKIRKACRSFVRASLSARASTTCYEIHYKARRRVGNPQQKKQKPTIPHISIICLGAMRRSFFRNTAYKHLWGRGPIQIFAEVWQHFQTPALSGSRDRRDGPADGAAHLPRREGRQAALVLAPPQKVGKVSFEFKNGPAMAVVCQGA